MKILNLTSHPILIHKKDGSEVTIEPSGITWRMKEEDRDITQPTNFQRHLGKY